MAKGISETKRSAWTAALIFAAAASVVCGIAARERVDLTALHAVKGRHLSAGSAVIGSRVVETDIPEDQYFEQMAELLKREYVEPIGDEMKLASGAVRGMVLSLADLRCRFFDPPALGVYQRSLRGKYEGIGVELSFAEAASSSAIANAPGRTIFRGIDRVPITLPDGFQRSQIPFLVASYVVPGGPAAKAGVKPGDWVESVDGHWVVNADAIDELRVTQQKVQAKEWPAENLTDLSRKLRQRSETAITPYRADERLSMGKAGTVSVVWRRGNQEIATRVAKSELDLGEAYFSGGALRFGFAPSVDRALADAVKGRGAIKIDLRGASRGDISSLTKCLSVFGPAGSYGQLVRQGGRAPLSLKVSKGAAEPPKITVLVDSRTRGVPEAFALSLASKGIAKLEGKSAGDPAVTELKTLPGGSAYLLVKGVYKGAGGGKS